MTNTSAIAVFAGNTTDISDHNLETVAGLLTFDNERRTANVGNTGKNLQRIVADFPA